ncbi:MAG: WHG domain-containing protein [Clostridia bacterium]|nr:WHG domain-containing protein [Clostridia bacterium]
MPPKAKFTKQEIVDAALSLIRERGTDALTARNLGQQLGSSSRPIFTLYQSMAQLQADVIDAAYALYHDYIARETATGLYPPYKASGMAYIRFAVEETSLFELLFMRKRTQEEIAVGICDPVIIERILQANAITREQAEQLYLEMWICVHGIATMLATSYFTMEWDRISEILTDTYQALREKIQKKGGHA